MTKIQIELPDLTAKAATEAGLLTPEALDRLLTQALRRRQVADSLLGSVDGDGLIHGTRIEAHRIAALIEGGMRPDEVRRDYPDLTPGQIESALSYAAAHPKQGRLYPSATVKSALRRGEGGLDLALGEEQEVE